MKIQTENIHPSRCNYPWSRFLGFKIVSGHDVDEEIELIEFGDGHGDVISLQSPSFVVFGVDPSAKSQLTDENLRCFGKQARSFSRNHFHLEERGAVTGECRRKSLSLRVIKKQI